MSLSKKFPPLYECSLCGAAVKVVPQGEGIEPLIKRKCKHSDAVVWANRKVTLRGKGKLNPLKQTQVRLTVTVRQFLSCLTGRSI